VKPLLREITETKLVFDTEKIQNDFGILFKKLSDPICIGIVTAVDAKEVRVVFFGQDDRTKVYERCYTTITVKEVEAGETKIEVFPLKFDGNK